ncbi:class I SAM-dependent methyltransferase [Streptomyces sp. NPDC059385]|uniref:class I SAM-dependent methyltransferase n=1 Tax=Streptomyces sp. NPDC059385 TaxID=3346817 RepID=UPI0036873BDD
MDEQRFGVWVTGDAYERYMGRWSVPVAERFVAWLGCADGLRWLDVGCGTGALSRVVAERCRPRAVLGVDPSRGFVASARAGAPAAARFVVGDAASLPARDAGWDVVGSGLVLNFLPEPGAALAEAVRVVRPGGLVAAYVWDYAEGMELLRRFWRVAVAVDPSAAEVDETRRFPVCRPEPLRALWADAGLAEVAVAPIEVATVFGDFDDLWVPFLAGQGPAPAFVAGSDPTVRERLREALRADVPARADGSIALTARAWAVKGRRRATGWSGPSIA